MRICGLGIGFVLAVSALAAADTRYFVVSELPGRAVHNDSYILPLNDPADIAHALALIEHGPDAGSSIVFADIAPGADGINRNWFSAEQDAWSWHVTGFRGFADIGAELYDGWPTFVEKDVAGWMQNTGGRVGFWSYTVTAEVPEPGTLVGVVAALLLLCRTSHPVKVRFARLRGR